MAMLRESLNPRDAAFLELEQLDDGALMHTGAALLFDPRADGAAPSRPELQARLEERLGMLPRLSARLSESRVEGLRRPAWVSDPTFDLTAHVRHATLPAPGRQAELHEWLGDFWSHRLDRARPLWEMTLVDGLEGGRWMLAIKMHHAMVDGVGLMDIFIGYVLLDTEPHPGPRPAPQPSEPGDGADRSELLGLLAPAVAAARAAIHIARHPSRLVRAGEAAVAMGNVLWQDELRTTRESSLNVPIGTTRRFTSVSIDLAAVKQIKQALGGPSTTSCSRLPRAPYGACSPSGVSRLSLPCRRWCRSTPAATTTPASATRSARCSSIFRSASRTTAAATTRPGLRPRP
jgi:diacylglycerol O-acyltransferase